MASKKCRDWLRKRGPTLTAHELGVSVSTVWAWIYGLANPTAKNAIKIIELSGRKLKLKDFIDDRE